MNNSQTLLERVRATTPNRSKEQLAKLLEMDRANLYRIYRGKGYPNAMICLKIADILRMDPRDVMAYVAEDKARTESAKEAVRRKLPRLLPAASLAISVAAGAMIASHTPAQLTGASIRLGLHYAYNNAIHFPNLEAI